VHAACKPAPCSLQFTGSQQHLTGGHIDPWLQQLLLLTAAALGKLILQGRESAKSGMQKHMLAPHGWHLLAGKAENSVRVLLPLLAI
jgi:hypothetical protein